MPALKPKPQEQGQPPQSPPPANEAVEDVVSDEDFCDPDDIDSWWTWPEDKMYPGNDVATLIEDEK